MPKKLPDPKTDIYTLLDRSGLNYAALTATRVPMRKLIEAVRREIVENVTEYITEREAKLNKEDKHGKV